MSDIGRTICNYRMYCNTEATNVFTWAPIDTPPTVCPNNNTHSIDSSSITIIDKVESNAIYALEPTEGYFRVEDIEMSVPSGTAGDVTTLTKSWEYEFNLWNASLMVTNDMIGDKLMVIVQPDTVVGVLTATANISDTVLNVNSTVTANMKPGFYISINGTNVGKCIAVNAGAGTITTNTALISSYSPGSYVQVNLRMIDNIVINSTMNSGFAKKGFKGKIVPANVPFKIFYTNNSTSAKEVVFRIEYYYAY